MTLKELYKRSCFIWEQGIVVKISLILPQDTEEITMEQAVEKYGDCLVECFTPTEITLYSLKASKIIKEIIGKYEI